VLNTEESTVTSNRRSLDNSIVVYPNPGNGEVRIRTEELSAKVDELRLYDIQGREIYREAVNVAQGHALRTRLSSGLYHLSLYFRDGLVKKQKLIVK
jgi:hypothetical protein